MTDLSVAVEALRERGGTVLFGRLPGGMFRVCVEIGSSGVHHHRDHRQPFGALLHAWWDASDADEVADPRTVLDGQLLGVPDRAEV